MNKKYIIRRNEDIQNIIKKNNKIVDKYYIVYFNKNDLNYNRYCVSVSKKIGKAVNRNLYKRRIKDILMKNKLDNSYDYVIILRNSILNIDYKLMEQNLIKTLRGVLK